MRNYRGIPDHTILNGPALLACHAFVSPRYRTVRCQACYGRRKCRCERGGGMPCVDGWHMTPGGKRAHVGGNTGRLNRGFVDINANRRGMSTR